MSGMLDGEVALISGGLGDIGRAIAEELARRGAAVAVSDLHGPDKAEALLATLKGHGAQARYDVADMADPQAIDAWVETVTQAMGVPTLVVPNAALVTVSSMLTVTPDEWMRELQVNLTGAFVMAQAAARRLVDAHRPGRIVFVGSWAAHRPHTNIPTYCVAKAGLRMAMKQLALALAPHDILVNEVAPGFVDAGLTGRFYEQEPARRQESIDRVPVHRLIEPADVAHEVAHLCDPATRHTTGATLLMDGGLSLLSGGMNDG